MLINIPLSLRLASRVPARHHETGAAQSFDSTNLSSSSMIACQKKRYFIIEKMYLNATFPILICDSPNFRLYS